MKYQVVYKDVYQRVLDHFNVNYTLHGSLVRDFFIEYAHGRFAVDDHAEKLLKELVEDGILRVLNREPTVSQRAFSGLQYSSKGYQDTPWGPGTIEHYNYSLAKP